MKFDFVIGNPPYQDETIGENDTYAPPVYNAFLDASFDVGKVVELIHPARFLFNAGSTPKAWNEKMLQDNHYKVLHYESDSSVFFSNTDIKGGIAISIRDENKDFGAIDTFTPYEELNSLLNKVRNSKDFVSFSSIIITSYAYHFTDLLYVDHPEFKCLLSKGHEYDFKSNVFEKMPGAFSDNLPDKSEQYLRILGRINNERCYKYINAKYVNEVSNLHRYKVFLSGATGTGQFGESIVEPIVGYPGDGTTETFMSIGSFSIEEDAKSTIKYIKTKFARALLGVLKRTQANTPGKWQWVPLQNFSSSSDVDWSKTIKQIDFQLYQKYRLSEEEIAFIESHVKEME